jgi:hypothetical protein
LRLKVVLGDGTLAVFSKERAAEVIGKIKAKVEEYRNDSIL